MKQCPKCSADNKNDAWFCDCGYKFNSTEPVTPETPDPRAKAVVFRMYLYAATWVIALLFLTRDIRLLPLFWLFPLGLMKPIALAMAPEMVGIIGFHGLIGGGWILYILHAVSFFRASRIPWMIFLYALLCALLLLNVSGCQEQLDTRF